MAWQLLPYCYELYTVTCTGPHCPASYCTVKYSVALQEPPALRQETLQILSDSFPNCIAMMAMTTLLGAVKNVIIDISNTV